MQNWSIREAKDRLSELVAAAQQAPQAITRRGYCAAVVLSEEEFRRLQRRAMPLSELFAQAGLGDVEIERVEASVRDEGEL